MINKKVHRSRDNKIIGGVASGLAEYFGTDPVIVRIIFLFLAFGGGAGILLYLLLWAMIPEEGHKQSVAEEVITTETATLDHHKHHRSSGNNVIGFFLIIVGLLFLLDNIFPMYSVERFWPLILIFFGLAVLFRDRK